MSRRHRLATTLFALALVAIAACSQEAADPLLTGEADLAGPAPTSTTPITSLPDVATLPLAVFEPDEAAELRQLVNPAMGGVRYSVSVDHTPATIHDTLVVFTEPPNAAINAPRSTAAISLVTQSIAASAVSTVEDFLRTVEDVDGAVVEPTGDAIELFGYRLRGYEMSNGADMEEPMLFSSARFGAAVDTEFSPFPYSLMYLADTPSGVLTAGLSGADEANARKSSGALATLLATAQLTGPGLDPPLPPGEVIAPTLEGAPPEPASLVANGPPPLEAAFAPVEPGRYQVPNVGRQLTLELDDGWVAQPNFPGMVVLTAPGSIGPGDRDLVLFSDVVEYLPTEAGPRGGGAPSPVTAIETLLADPPPGFATSNVSTGQLGAASVTQFDLTTDPAATCALGEPCEATIVTSYGVTKPLAAGFDHRIWWIEHETGPATVFTATALDDPEFIERATAAVGTVDFD